MTKKPYAFVVQVAMMLSRVQKMAAQLMNGCSRHESVSPIESPSETSNDGSSFSKCLDSDSIKLVRAQGLSCKVLQRSFFYVPAKLCKILK